MTSRRRRFIEEYTVDFNATQAAIRAGYSKKRAGLYAYDLMQVKEVREAIDQRMNELTMSADEATYRLTALAKSSLEPFLEIIDDENFTFRMNSEDAKKALHTIKKLEKHTTTDKEGNKHSTIKIELHDSLNALDKVLKIHGKYAPDKLQITDDSHDQYIRKVNSALGED